MPKSNVPGEQTSPTQPFPVKPEPLAQNQRRPATTSTRTTPEHQGAVARSYVDDNHMRAGRGPLRPAAAQPIHRTAARHPGRRELLWRRLRPQARPLFIANVNNLGQPMRIVRNPDGSYSNSGPPRG